MRRIFFLVLLACLLALGGVAHADGPSHIVAYGETLYSIARAYGVSPEALANANGITTQSWVYAGQELTIPGQSTSSSAPVPSAATATNGAYTVRAGDTLTGVANAFGVSIQALAQANNIPPNGFLYTGWQLNIPGTAASNASAASASASNAASASNESKDAASELDAEGTYIVKPGDTLSGIAVAFGVTTQAIAAANNLSTLYVFSNQRLTIPGAVTSAPSSKKTVDSANASAKAPGLNLRVEDVPLERQEQTLTCEEAAASMATRGALTEKQIVDAMTFSENPFEGIRGETNYSLFGGLTHYGTYAQGLQKALTKLGHHSTTYYGQTYPQFKATILDSLKQGRPVIWWTTWRESYQTPQTVKLSNGLSIPLTPYEHSVVIVAANDDGVTYHDPYDGTERFTSWANHQRTSGYFNNMALVVY